MAKEDDKLEFDGEVIDSNNSIFKVKVNDNQMITAKISGKIRKNNIRILLGDKVKVMVSAYDLNTGIITQRLK